MKKLIPFFFAAASFCCAESRLEILISPETIAEKVQAAALQIDQDFQGEELSIVMVMKGAVTFTADLMRQLHIPFTLDYIKASSYGKRGSQRGDLTIQGIEDLDIAGKNVLLVDDIFDSGQTLTALNSELSKKGPKSLKTIVLLVKDVARNTDYLPDYSLFHIHNRFVVGYGLDRNELFRGLPGIYAFAEEP